MISKHVGFRFAFVAVLLFPVQLFSQNLPDLVAAQVELQKARKESLAPAKELQQLYEAELQKLRTKVLNEGNPTKVIAVDHELKNFREGTINPAPNEFQELKRLQALYETGLASRLQKASAALAPALEAYRQKILESRKLLTQSERLEEALELDGKLPALGDLVSVATLTSILKEHGVQPVLERPTPKPSILGNAKSGTIRVAGFLGAEPIGVPKGSQAVDALQLAPGLSWLALRSDGSTIGGWKWIGKPSPPNARADRLAGYSEGAVILQTDGSLHFNNPKLMESLDFPFDAKFMDLAVFAGTAIGVRTDGTLYCNIGLPDLPETANRPRDFDVIGSKVGLITEDGRVYAWEKISTGVRLMELIPSTPMDAVEIDVTDRMLYVRTANGAVEALPTKEEFAEPIFREDMNPVQRIRAGGSRKGTGVAVEYLDGSWEAFGDFRPEVKEVVDGITKPIDLVVMANDSSNFVVWIEP